MEKNPLCPICSKPAPFFANKDGYTIHECGTCSLSFVFPQPAPAYLKEEVYSEKSGYQGNKAKDLSKVVPTSKQRKVVDFFRGQQKGKVLDIGCSSGEMMFFLRGMGFEVKGIELNPKTASIAEANGLRVDRKTLEEQAYEAASFDYVYMGDLIEHVNDPVSLVRESRRILKPGGSIVIITPNMDCFWGRATRAAYKLLRIPWGAVTPPHHLYQFSRDNLAQLLEQNGFRVTSTWYTGTPSLKYELGSLHLLKRWKKDRKVSNLLYMIVAFSIYAVLFGINRIVELFPVRRFSMAMVAVLG